MQENLQQPRTQQQQTIIPNDHPRAQQQVGHNPPTGVGGGRGNIIPLIQPPNHPPRRTLAHFTIPKLGNQIGTIIIPPTINANFELKLCTIRII